MVVRQQRLASQRLHNRGRQRIGDLDQRLARPERAMPGQDDDASRLIQKSGRSVKVCVDGHVTP
jgi:ribose 1,5-bisphosphokinase PhnN